MTLDKARQHPGETRGNAAKSGRKGRGIMAPILEVIWQTHMLLLQANGGLGPAHRPTHTAAQRLGLAAAAYAEGWDSLKGDGSLLMDVAPLWERLDAAASAAIDSLLNELPQHQIDGLLAFQVLFVRKAGQRFRQGSADGGKDG
jgi:hypothetical protein